MRPRGFQSTAMVLTASLVLASPAAYALPSLSPSAHSALREGVLHQLAPKSPDLARGRALLQEGEFEAAIKVLQRGLSQPDLTDDQLVEFYRNLGLAHLYLGDEVRAREAFEKLLQAQPDFEVSSSAPPKVRSLYARIKDDIRKRRVRPVTLDVEPPEEIEGGAPLRLEAQIEDLALGSKAKLYYRRAGGQAYSSVDFSRSRDGEENAFLAVIPAFELPKERQSYDVEFYVEVADAAQRRLAGHGDAFNPLTFRVEGEEGPGVGPGEDRPWYANPWIWVGVGAVAIGATAGIVVLASQRQTGTVTITIPVEGQ